MPSRSLFAACLLAATCLGLLAATDGARRTAGGDPPPGKPRPTVDRVLPGLRQDGFVQLPNQWRLRPAGTSMEVGSFPVHIAVHPSGKYLAILHAGMGDHEVVTVAVGKRPRIVSRAVLEQTFYGLCFSPDGRHVFASGGELERVHRFDFDRGYLSNPREIDLSGPKVPRLIVGGLSTDARGKELFAAGTWGDVVFRVPLDRPEELTVIRLTEGEAPEIPAKGEEPGAPVKEKERPKGDPPSPPDGREDPGAADPTPGLERAPYAVLPEPGGKRLFVSLWSRAAVAVIDLETNKVVAEWPTARHPTEMALSPDGKALYVSCANSTKVSVIDPATGKGLQTIGCALYPTAPAGNTPDSLSISPDGKLLFVSNADANNLAVFNIEDRARAKPLGFIPTGWYPTSVRYLAGERRIYVTNGKGMVPKSNRSGPNPALTSARNLQEYIGELYQGTLSVIDLPDPEQMGAYTKLAYACSPLRKGNAVNAGAVEAGNPIPRKPGDPSPIKYVIYVIKENRTYDQIFGDMPEGNGEPELCLFPEPVTPNHHKLAREFVLLDNCYVEGEVSADGHEWSMGAYATDFVEKSWPLTYRGSPRGKIGYPSEGAYDHIARPAGGYLWDRAKEAGVSYRSYGEWVENGKTPDDPGKAKVPALEGHIDPHFRGYDLDYPDVKRAERFISELRRFEKEGGMPRLSIVRLPNDHTYGTRVGKPTPTAMVADNDLALGMLVEAVSKSKFWKETAIFVIEDDAQNGPDHVDAHRVAALVISPYAKRRHVDSTLYSTSSMLRTMELILGLEPMSQFDAAARPMYASFTAEPDFTPYEHVVPRADRDEKNVAGAWGAEWCETPDLTRKEDAVDDLIFNEVIWKAVRGADSPVPPPVRAAFFLPEPEDGE